MLFYWPIKMEVRFNQKMYLLLILYQIKTLHSILFTKMLAMFKEKEQQNRFTAYNHIEMVMIEQDHAIFRLNICPESKNSFGMVHGGAIYAMADNATGFAAHTDGRNYVTQTSSLHFLRNQPEGEIQADARVRHRGRSTCLVAVDILGEDETLLATGEFTFFCVDMKMMEQRVKNSL